MFARCPLDGHALQNKVLHFTGTIITHPARRYNGEAVGRVLDDRFHFFRSMTNIAYLNSCGVRTSENGANILITLDCVVVSSTTT